MKLTDREWAVIKPMLKTSRAACCGVNDRRVFFNGIFWVFRPRAMDRATPGFVRLGRSVFGIAA
ncbi:MAG: transposase [Mesorhizobium sp.]|nr:MAG: transposase [Mesorhizobium sp.]RWM85239.1 MAG: transposase [Mesorhizobium sp.]